MQERLGCELASMTSGTSSPPRPPWCTRCISPTARWCACAPQRQSLMIPSLKQLQAEQGRVDTVAQQSKCAARREVNWCLEALQSNWQSEKKMTNLLVNESVKNDNSAKLIVIVYIIYYGRVQNFSRRDYYSFMETTPLFVLEQLHNCTDNMISLSLILQFSHNTKFFWC